MFLTETRTPAMRQCQICCEDYTEWADYRMPSDYRCEGCFTRELAIPLICLFSQELLREDKLKWLQQQSW